MPEVPLDLEAAPGAAFFVVSPSAIRARQDSA